MSYYGSAPPLSLDVESAVVETSEEATPVSRSPSVVVDALPVRGDLPAGAQLVRVDSSFLLGDMQRFEAAEYREAQRTRRRNNGAMRDSITAGQNDTITCCMKCKTFSTVICLAQVIILYLMIRSGGWADRDVNPLYGPPPETLDAFGAKNAAKILYRNEWWRLVTPILLHAGILHIASNLLIQLRAGAYLEIIWGHTQWITVYVLGGVYGNLASCIFLPDTIGVGSSGALMGMLGAWVIFLLVRWNKYPKEQRGERNCQFIVVCAAIIITIMFSQANYVDWAAHLGGLISGTATGIIVFVGDYDGYFCKAIIRVFMSIALVAFYVASLAYFYFEVKPPRSLLDI